MPFFNEDVSCDTPLSPEHPFMGGAIDFYRGPKGEDGIDGISPTVAVAEIEGGHRVTITDAAGAHIFDVMDGESAGTFNIHALTEEITAADADELPFYSTSAGHNRKITFSNFISKAKQYFDTLYLNASALIGYATVAWVQSQGYGTYSKPVSGIPKADLSSAVQSSLDKADAAVSEDDLGFIIPEGLDKTGTTDMSTVIQDAIDDGNVYLPDGTYRIDTPLSFSGAKQFICAGELVAAGNGIVVYGQKNDIAVRKITATGHSCCVIGRGGYTDTNRLSISEMAGANGIELVDEGSGTQYTTLEFGAISATNYGIYVHSTTNYITETIICGGHIGGGALKGIYLHTDYNADLSHGVQAVHAVNCAVEGINASGVAIEMVRSLYNVFERVRISESVGATVLKMAGVCSYNRIGCALIHLELVDITALDAASKGNVVIGRISDDAVSSGYFANIAHIDGGGISFEPMAYRDINMSNVPDVTEDGATYKDISYDNLGYIATSVYCNNGTESVTNIRLGREYSDMASAAFGTAVIFRVVTGYKPKIYDATGAVIYDASAGVPHSGQLLIRCVGNARVVEDGDTLHVPSWEVTYSAGINDRVTELAKIGDIPTQLNQLTGDSTHRLVTDAEKTAWNDKYSVPTGGIPKTDLASAVQDSLELADSALQAGDLPAPEVFTAVYGTTTYAEIAAAYNAGKKVQCKREASGSYYVYDLTLITNEVVRFGQLSNTTLYSCFVGSDDAWGAGTALLSDFARTAQLEVKADKPTIKSAMDAVAVVNTQYFLGTQSAVTVTLPSNAVTGAEILVCFASGATAATLVCNLTGFDFVPSANKTSWLKFTSIGSGDWLVETKEG